MNENAGVEYVNQTVAQANGWIYYNPDKQASNWAMINIGLGESGKISYARTAKAKWSDVICQLEKLRDAGAKFNMNKAADECAREIAYSKYIVSEGKLKWKFA